MKVNLLKAALPISVALFAMTLGSCSQDEQLIEQKGEQQNESKLLDKQADIQNFLRTLPLAPNMTRATAPVSPNDGTPVPVDENAPVLENEGVLNGIPGNWVKTTRLMKTSFSTQPSTLFILVACLKAVPSRTEPTP